MLLSETAAIITGGASGLGEATARHFRQQGAEVTLFDLDAVRGAQVADEIGAHFVQADVTDETSVEDAVTAAAKAMGKVTAVLNCAGIAPAEKTLGKNGPHRLDLFRKIIDINLIGTFNVARLAAAEIAKTTPAADGTRGVIINTASIAAFEAQRGQTGYGASKGGVLGLSLPMARDLARDGIRVMAIAPGIFGTPMLRGLPQDVQDNLAQDVTFPKRLGDPAEFAALAGFIVECDYLNGEIIRIDGAMRLQ